MTGYIKSDPPIRELLKNPWAGGVNFADIKDNEIIKRDTMTTDEMSAANENGVFVFIVGTIECTQGWSSIANCIVVANTIHSDQETDCCIYSSYVTAQSVVMDGSNGQIDFTQSIVNIDTITISGTENRVCLGNSVFNKAIINAGGLYINGNSTCKYKITINGGALNIEDSHLSARYIETKNNGNGFIKVVTSDINAYKIEVLSSDSPQNGAKSLWVSYSTIRCNELNTNSTTKPSIFLYHSMIMIGYATIYGKLDMSYSFYTIYKMTRKSGSTYVLTSATGNIENDVDER